MQNAKAYERGCMIIRANERQIGQKRERQMRDFRRKDESDVDKNSILLLFKSSNLQTNS